MPRLPGGTPFPTSLYLTLPSMVQAVSRLEAEGRMAELTDDLGKDPHLAEGYRHAHQRYLDRRLELADVPEIAGISAGGMPTRVKCLHAVVGQGLAEGPGVNPIADLVLAELRGVADIDVCRCAPEDPAPAADRRDEGTT